MGGELEYHAQELGIFVAELAKGNPSNVELLFSEDVLVHNGLWQQLRSVRCCFLTLRCARQYFGFASERLQLLKDLLVPGSSFEASQAQKASKWLYHAHHRMMELRRVLSGQSPVVKLSGAER